MLLIVNVCVFYSPHVFGCSLSFIWLLGSPLVCHLFQQVCLRFHADLVCVLDCVRFDYVFLAILPLMCRCLGCFAFVFFGPPLHITRVKVLLFYEEHTSAAEHPC